MCGIYTQLELVELQDFKINNFYKNERRYGTISIISTMCQAQLYSYNYVYLYIYSHNVSLIFYLHLQVNKLRF